jgi:mannosylglycoprotein endo-beta-mannosidase
MGKQPLYNVAISIDVKGFGESDSWSHLFGFRKIESHIDDATGGRYAITPISSMFVYL